MKKQIVKSVIFQSQSSAKRNVLVNFLVNTSNNIKWLKFATTKLNVLSRLGLTGCLEAQDYVSEAKVMILEIVSVINAYTPDPRFTITVNGKTFVMVSAQLSNYVCLLIKWQISRFFRNEQKTIPLPHWDEDEEGEMPADDEILLCRKNLQSEYVVPFNDPFDDNLLSEEFIEEFCKSLEKSEPLLGAVLAERLKGIPNRLIARKYKISVRQVEIIRKTLKRRLSYSKISRSNPD